MRFACDIETACNVPICSGKGCEHALTPHTARITVVGMWSPTAARVFRNLEQFSQFINSGAVTELVGHNFKFDLKMLALHQCPISEDLWADDSCLQAVANYEKIPDEWLADYAVRRSQVNEKLIEGNEHRRAGKHSLKTLAPYHLGVEPFWETPDNHDNDKYVLLDCEYTYRLCEFQAALLKAQGTYDYYKTYLLTHAKMLLEGEVRGIKLDMQKVEEGEKRAAAEADAARQKLEELWKPIFEAHYAREVDGLKHEYAQKAEVAKAKLKRPTPIKTASTEMRYRGLCEQAVSKLDRSMNLNSPTQLRLILRDYLKLDIRTLEGKESTDAEVLERLAAEGRDDVALLLKYREQNKLVTTYYSAFKELSHDGILHANFHLDVARTGRTSSSNPNLQNQPPVVRDIFVARPGYKLVTKDLAAIEPALIAYYTEDKLLYDVIASGQKFHSYNARALFQEPWDIKKLKDEHPNEYDAAKEGGLSVLYGAGKTRVRVSMTKRKFFWSEERCKQAVYSLRNAWPGVKQFKEALDEYAIRNPITNMYGRKRKFPLDEIYMKAFNDLIQGTASTLLLRGAYNARQEFKAKGIDAHILMWVHDETVVEAPAHRADEVGEILTRCMTTFDLPTRYGNVPLRVEGKISDHWSK